MIAFIEGTLYEKTADLAVIQAGGVGVSIHIPLSVTEALPAPGNQVRLYTWLKVAEDALTLYGFLSERDREMFCRLISVNGIGPKGALAILSAMTQDALRLAVLTGDAKSIAKAPGIGLKTAQRIILDLKDKVNAEDLLPESAAAPASEPSGEAAGTAAREAMEALTQLGYSAAEAGRAVRAVSGGEEMDSTALLKAALKTFRI